MATMATSVKATLGGSSGKNVKKLLWFRLFGPWSRNKRQLGMRKMCGYPENGDEDASGENSHTIYKLVYGIV